MKKFLKFAGFAALTVLITGLVFGCSDMLDDESSKDSKGKATVVFKITDAPFPADLVEEAYVTIDWIKLLKAGKENAYDEEEAESENASFVLVELEEPATFNLLDLRNGLTAVLAEVELPAGSYSEIRLHVTDAGIVLKNGLEYPLKVPSGDASGLKLKLASALTLADGEYAEVLFDFDVNRSFVMKGNANHIIGFNFKPVVRAVAHLGTHTGEVAGNVADADGNDIENAVLTLMEGEEVITTALTSEDGFYAMIGISPGTYTLVLQVDEYVDELEITVEAGKVSVKNFVTATETDDNDEE
jgi:hypothetical protein